MDHDEHSKRSREAFGWDDPRVHEWLDHYWQSIGPGHRILRHHKLGIDTMCREFAKGEELRELAEKHILDDLGWIPADPRDMCLQSPMWCPTSEELPAVIAELLTLYGDDFGLGD